MWIQRHPSFRRPKVKNSSCPSNNQTAKSFDTWWSNKCSRWSFIAQNPRATIQSVLKPQRKSSFPKFEIDNKDSNSPSDKYHLEVWPYNPYWRWLCRQYQENYLIIIYNLLNELICWYLDWIAIYYKIVNGCAEKKEI